jgi:signal transduction histidine kinase
VKLFDMSDYPRSARIYWWTLVALGYAMLAFNGLELARMAPGVQLRVAFAGLLTGVVALFSVKIPTRGVKISVEAGDIFVLLTLLVYGPAAAAFASVCGLLVGAIRTSKRATSRIGSPAAGCIAITLTGNAFWAARGSIATGPEMLPTLALLLATAFAYTCIVVLLLRAVFALKAGEPVRLLAWLREYLWICIFSMASASVAAVLYTSEGHLGLEAILVAVPLVAIFVGPLHFYFEKKKADERHLAELMESERRLQEALKTAEAASRAKTRFLAAASHDLRQPLHALSFLTAALDMRPLDAVSRDIVRKMSDALEDLAVEFDALLDISKLDAGLVPVTASTFEVQPFLQRIAGPFGPAAAARGLAFELAAERGLFVRTDRALLERLLRNLMDNAVKYTHAGKVQVACRARSEHCIIEVIDTGAGIPQHEHEHVFEEFYQLGNPERDRRNGMGLGLSIVRRLATLLGLDLRMDSKEGLGTTFTLALETSAAPRVEPVQALAAPAEFRDRQVLVVDDEASAREALRGYLEALGCRVSVAGTAAEAAALAMLDEPDIVLADVRLRQGETGLAVIDRLRETRPELRAIIMTGDTAPERLAELDATGIEVLHKPVVPARLVESMSAQLKASA